MTVTVHGNPKPQGSKKFVGVSKRGRGILVESCAQVKNWREAVKWAFIEAGSPHVGGPVAVSIVFEIPRPKSANKRNSIPGKKPDLDKLLRSTFDAITEVGGWEDDSRVVSISAQKKYSPFGGFPAGGAVITIEGEPHAR